MNKYGLRKGNTTIHPEVCAITGFRLVHGYTRVMLPGLDGVCVGVMPGHTLGAKRLKQLAAEYKPPVTESVTPAIKPETIPADKQKRKTPARKTSAKKAKE